MEYVFHARHYMTAVLQSLNVVAALDVWSGDIVWRQFLPDNEPIDLIRISSAGTSKVVVVLSGGGKYIRVFSMSTGDLYWDDVTRSNKVQQAEPMEDLSNINVAFNSISPYSTSVSSPVSCPSLLI